MAVTRLPRPQAGAVPGTVAAMDVGALEQDTQALARRIAELGEGERSRVFKMSWWSDRMMDWAMSRPAFKTQLFRFVDVFPALDGQRRHRPSPR